MKTLVAVLLAVLLVGCESKEDRARAAVHEAAVAVSAYFGPLGPAETAESKVVEIVAAASERIDAARALYPAESQTARDLAQMQALLKRSSQAKDFTADGTLKALASTLQEQFKP